MKVVIKHKLYIVVNVDRFFLSHRLPVALAAKEDGYDVSILTKDTGYRKKIESYGFHFIEIPFERSGSNPLHEWKCIWKLMKTYYSGRPDIIHHVTLKAALLGSIAAKLAGIRNVVNAISGFGYNFTDGRSSGIKQKVIMLVMCLAFKSRYFHFILQNPDDLWFVTGQNYTLPDHLHLIKGSGIDLSSFAFRKEIRKQKVRLILPARMLYDKGVVEFVEAAKKIKDNVSDKAEFLLAGDCDMDNLAGIPEETLREMTDGHYIRWIGFKDSMYEELAWSDIVVLPSYREGLPKSLIEACSVGRPVITTDSIGCRECVIDGYNGFLVPVKDTGVLAEKMELLVKDERLRKTMGENSRILAEKEFSIYSVIYKHLEIYRMFIQKPYIDENKGYDWQKYIFYLFGKGA